MKKIFAAHLPYAPQLDELETAEVANCLEEVGTRFSVESLNWPDQFPYRPLTVVSAAHSGKYIYLDFLVRCNYLRAVNYTPNSPVSEDSCVEFFVSPEPGSKNYWNFEFNCIGTVLAEYHPDGAPARFLTPEELSGIKVYASVQLSTNAHRPHLSPTTFPGLRFQLRRLISIAPSFLLTSSWKANNPCYGGGKYAILYALRNMSSEEGVKKVAENFGGSKKVRTFAALKGK